MTGESFLMVYGDGQSAPTVKHGSYDDAKREATRLARANGGTTFFVLRAVTAVSRNDVVVVDLVDDDGMPPTPRGNSE